MSDQISVGSCPTCGTLVQIISEDGIWVDEYRPVDDICKLKGDLGAASRFITRFIIHDGQARPYSVRELQMKLEQAEAALAERDEELKHLHSRWTWTEYWFDNLYPSDWQRCQAKYDATKTGARPVADSKHVCYLCHQPIQPNQESEEWEPGYHHFECPARAEEGSGT